MCPQKHVWLAITWYCIKPWLGRWVLVVPCLIIVFLLCILFCTIEHLVMNHFCKPTGTEKCSELTSKRTKSSLTNVAVSSLSPVLSDVVVHTVLISLLHMSFIMTNRGWTLCVRFWSLSVLRLAVACWVPSEMDCSLRFDQKQEPQPHLVSRWRLGIRPHCWRIINLSPID